MNKKMILDIPEEISIEDDANDDRDLIRKKNANTTEKREKNKKEDGKCKDDCMII